VYRETEIRQARFKVDGEVFDPQELKHEFKAAFVEADLEAERAVGNVPRNKLFIFKFWEVKKKILKSKYSISWSSPAELNPSIVYENYGQPQITELEKKYLFEIVKQHLVNSSETIFGAYRDYKGTVYVSTRETNSDISRQYTLSGHDNIWSFVSVGIVEE
jgi:hypothetical protein